MVNINVECPSCSKTLYVPPHLAGKTAVCPHCRQMLHIPQPAALPQSRPLPTITTTPRNHTRRSYSRNKSTLPIVFGVMSFLVLLLLVVFYIQAIGRFDLVVGKPASKSPQLPTFSPNLNPLWSIKPGRVRITVTWQFNELVGTKPDLNAKVILIPAGYPDKIATDGLWQDAEQFFHFDETKKKLFQQGIHAGLIGGDGKTLIADVPVGNYTMVIISNKTSANTASQSKQGKIITRHFKGNTELLNFAKVYVTEIKVTSGEESEYSHDFGFKN